MPHYRLMRQENSTVPWYRHTWGEAGPVSPFGSWLDVADGSSAFCRGFRQSRQADQKGRPWPLVWLGPQTATMRLDDRATLWIKASGLGMLPIGSVGMPIDADLAILSLFQP